jgi:two-component system, NtrC family, nitrogen regulation sensor histidine kinase NtrY
MDPNLTSDLEHRKRKRERRVVWIIAASFLIVTLFQAFLTQSDQGYTFWQSLLYFALLHLNVIFIMVLVFLVSRNLIKAYLLRRSGGLGASLKWKMVTSMLLFSILPSLFLFSGSAYVIRQGFDRWFSDKVATALRDAQSISKVHYDGIESNLSFFADRIIDEIGFSSSGIPDVSSFLGKFPVESIAIYPASLARPVNAARIQNLESWNLPLASAESLVRARGGEKFVLIRKVARGDLLQRYMSFEHRGERYVLELSHTVPLGLKTRISELQVAFASYQQTQSYKDALKTRYTLMLLTLFVLVIFVVTWFGLYIAKSVTDPVSELLAATAAYREGKWSYRIPSQQNAKDDNASAAADLDVLKAAFNLMGEEVGRREKKLGEANLKLSRLVRELKEREQYLEILLSSIHRGVVVLDLDHNISRANTEALDFATDSNRWNKNDPSTVQGLPWREVFSQLGSDDEAQSFLAQAGGGRSFAVDKLFELQQGVGRGAEVSSVRATGIQLVDGKEAAIGWMLILEDVSDAARIERLAAWQEVAKRVAHEIKNPLTPIQISADRLRRQVEPKLEGLEREQRIFAECLDQIQKQVRSIRDLVTEFSNFAKMPEPKLRPVDLVQELTTILNDYRFTHPHVHFDFDQHIAGRPIKILADPEHVRQLVVNLADNALQSLEEAKIPDPTFRIVVARHETHGDRSVAVLRFEDNGPGVSESMSEKIFDPYISSKLTGLGLGLAIVRRIAMEHYGKVRCEPGPGGRFVIELPELITNENAV